MSQTPPRHLAPRHGLAARRRSLLFVGGAAVLVAAGAVAIAVVSGGPSQRGLRVPQVAPSTSLAPSSAPATSGPAEATTTTGTARPLREIPGNLLANGDFESGLSGWSALDRARVDRIAIAHSGAWAVRVRPAEGGASGRPGIAVPLSLVARQGRGYQGSAWVRASRPGMQVTLALREEAGDGRSSADVIGVDLPDGEWHEIAVVHQVQLEGARLSLELASANLGAGQLILVDEVGVTTP